MRRIGGRKYGCVLRVTRGLDEIAPLLGDGPMTSISRDLEMCDVDARRPVLWLNQQRLADRRPAILLMGVAVEDEIDSRNLSTDPRSNVFAGHVGRGCVVAGRLVESGVNGDENDVRPGCANFLDCLPDRRHDVAKTQATSNVLGVPDRHAGCCRTDDSNAQTRALDDRPRPVGVYSLRLNPVSIRGEEREPRLTNRR